MTTSDLTTLVPDVPKAAYLESMLEKTTSSYKFFWLKGIIDAVCTDEREMSFASVVARMVASAWYPVLFFHLSLGATDQLGKIVYHVQEVTGLPQNASTSEVIDAVLRGMGIDDQLLSMVGEMTNYVPYRLIRPFYEQEVRAEQRKLKEQGVKRPDSKVDYILIRLNQEEPEKALYAINAERTSLVVSSQWVDFIQRNQAIIYGWLDAKLTHYLQMRNPSVPAISMKLRSPRVRDLASAKRYWTRVSELASIDDIYLHERLDLGSYEEFGAMSIDHFVPWSFVLHDEAWNLTPTFRNVNSSKSDHLPDLELYLSAFCDMQFDALATLKGAGELGKFRQQMDSYRMIDVHVDEYDAGSHSRELFTQSLKNTILPLYQIALNQGYSIWAA